MNLTRYRYTGTTGLLLLACAAHSPAIAETTTTTTTEEAHYRCAAYADKAVQQNQLNKQYGCGYSGLRWNDDRTGQYQWCLTVRDKVSYAEEDARRDLLEQCFSRKTDRNNPDNRPAIPAACQDSSKTYQAVKSIYSAFRYEKTITSPVQDGLIRYDYNRDNQDDYIFLALKDDMAHLSVCLSQPQGYQRKISGLVFYAPGDSTESDQYSISQQDDILRIDVSFFGHNMGSAYSSTQYRYNPARRAFDIVDRTSNSSPVEMDGQPYPMSSPPSPDMTLRQP